MDEDSCEICWWYWCSLGTYPSCNHPCNLTKADSEIIKPCGWFEPKDEPIEIDEHEEFQKIWN